MMLISCPWCGPRDETEFHYGGQAHVAHPPDPNALTDAEWAEYLFVRDNPKGPFAERWVHALDDAQWGSFVFARENPKGPLAERWCHSSGCRRWFEVVRDTATHEILAVYRPDEPRPVMA